MSGIMAMFRNVVGAANPQSTKQQTSAESNPTVPNQNNPKNGENIPGLPPNPTGTESPLENYAELWNAPTNGTNLPSTVPQLTIDPVKLDTISKGIDFGKAINKELLVKASSGDAEALSQVISQAVQAGYAQAAGTSAQLVEKALQGVDSKLQKELLPEVLRRADISRSLSNNNPLYQDPAVAPMLKMLETQMAAKYPKATPEQIRESAVGYLQATSRAILSNGGFDVVTKDTTTKNKGPVETDWEKWAGENFSTGQN